MEGQKSFSRFHCYVDCQPLNSKRPYDLPVKKKQHENIFSIRTINPPIQTFFLKDKV